MSRGITPYCQDCPDREACMTGFSCEHVRAVANGTDPETFTGSKADDIWCLVAVLIGIAGTAWFVWEVFLR